MSRLDSFIRRLQAQRACLDRAAELIRELPGPILELGLGNGRTYDHLRERLPERDIYVCERQVAAHPDCIPPARFLIIGDVRETLPEARARLGAAVALIHADLGSGDDESNRRQAAELAPLIAGLLQPGGIVVSDQALVTPRLRVLELPAEVKPGRYFLYRAAGS
ncbi:MAG TPA: class I SAM-dependent methyltransferase [Candidatus Angelobacter sp.]|nr:class I SAM-dependent methyltransferase [Candidatus Angelobacter sp.]